MLFQVIESRYVAAVTCFIFRHLKSSPNESKIYMHLEKFCLLICSTLISVCYYLLMLEKLWNKKENYEGKEKKFGLQGQTYFVYFLSATGI